ncbi:MAG TPA: MFS transporter [Vicinamibacterales bacterium]
MSEPMPGRAGLTRHQLLVLTVAYLGWVFDLMDVFLMVLVKDRAMAELLGPGASQRDIGVWGGWALGITLVGWSAGGLLFGMVADRWGRTRTMALTILIYSVFTGLTGLAQTPMQLLVLRFIAALGIGGEWGAGASMIAEVFPKASRAMAAGILQSASGTGFFAAILLEWLVGGNWRYAFFAGAVPAFLALVVRLGLHEPEAWVAARRKAAGLRARVGSLAAIFEEPELGRRLLLATALAVIGIFAYWGTNFWVNSRFTELLRGQGADPATIASGVRTALLVLNVGNMVGFLSYIPITNRVGRIRAFTIFHAGALVSMPVAFLFSTDYETGLVLFFFAGLFTSGIYSGYTIYFPELFPTRVRATGASFCYNVGRIVAAPGPVLMGWLTGALERVAPAGQQIAYAGAIMGCVYLLAFAVIPFLPETQGVELTEDQALD